jgi:polyketide synthase 12
VRPGCVAAFAFEDASGTDAVGVVAELATHRGPVDAKAARLSIVRAIRADHGVEVAWCGLVAQGAVPKTTSGNIQRQLCRQMASDGSFITLVEPYDANENGAPEASGGAKHSNRTVDASELMQWMRGEVARIAKQPPDDIGIDTSFASLGLASIHLVEFVSALSRHIGRPLPASLAFDHPTIVRLARAIASTDRDANVKSDATEDMTDEEIKTILSSIPPSALRGTDALAHLIVIANQTRDTSNAASVGDPLPRVGELSDDDLIERFLRRDRRVADGT